MTNANLQSRLDEAQSKIQTLQDEIISVQVSNLFILLSSCFHFRVN